MGNKTSILSILYSLFPLNYERYIEPFGGSGAVLLGKPAPDRFEVLNDYNRNLVNLYRCMRDRPVEFIRALGFLNLNARDDFNVLKKFFRKVYLIFIMRARRSADRFRKTKHSGQSRIRSFRRRCGAKIFRQTVQHCACSHSLHR